MRLLLGPSAVEAGLLGVQDPPKVLWVRSDKSKDKRIGKIVRLAESRGVAVNHCDNRQLDKLASGLAHQNIVAESPDFVMGDADDVRALAKDQSEPLFVACDQLQDPQNLGSIARSAMAFGCHGLLLPSRRTVGVTDAAIRASAGALEMLRVFDVGNLADILLELKDCNVWVTGLTAAGSVPLDSIDFTGGVCVVLGSEGSGLRKRVAGACDQLAQIAMPGGFESLNVGVAAGIALHTVVCSRLRAKK